MKKYRSSEETKYVSKKKNRSHLFWGIGFLLIAVFIILNFLGIVNDVNIIKLSFAIFLVFVIIRSAIKLSFAGILFPLAFIAILYEKELNLTGFVPWPALLTAGFASLGLYILFKKDKRKFHRIYFHNDHNDSFTESIEDIDDSEVICNVNFGGTSKYINSQNFKKALIRSNFGGVSLYFDKAIIEGDEAFIYFDVAFSGIELYVPRDWKIINDANVSLGAIDESKLNQDAKGPNVYLKGNIKLSGVDIIYV